MIIFIINLSIMFSIYRLVLRISENGEKCYTFKVVQIVCFVRKGPQFKSRIAFMPHHTDSRLYYLRAYIKVKGPFRHLA